MQQLSSKRISRKGQTKKERKETASVVRSNKLEQGLMLLTGIRAVVVSNQNCNTDLPNDVLHSASESVVENAGIIRVIELMCSKNISSSRSSN
jgi:hypothetical protein